MKILVTGGAGFIGSNFIRLLINNSDYEVVNLDKLTYAGNLNNLKDIETKRYKFIKGDICNPEDVKIAAKDCSIIVNFAAESHVDRSIQDPSSFIKTDIFGAFNLLEEARKNNIQFCQISTDETYGQILDGSFTETSPLMPRNPYSASKTGADRLAYSYFATYGLKVIITRSSNNFGPFQYPEKIIPLFIANLLTGKKVPVYGTGKNVRDWLYVEDNCEGIKICMEKGKSGEVYNIGGGNELQNIELTKMILQELNLSEDRIEFVEDRKGHDFRYSLNCDKIKKELSWKPKHEFKSALKKTVNWYKGNEWWWKPLIK